MDFASEETLFIIRIENNDPSHYYCYNLKGISNCKEKEILITSNCSFQVTNIEKKTKKEIYLQFLNKKIEEEENEEEKFKSETSLNKISEENLINEEKKKKENEEYEEIESEKKMDLIYLTCLGYKINYN